MSNLRWLIIGLIFFVTVINYIDRQTVSVPASVISQDLGLSNVEFGTITVWFLVAYTLSQAISGKIYDGIIRTTFIINEKGIIANVITDVKTKEHGKQVLGL